MYDSLGIGLITLGACLVVAGTRKRRSRIRSPLPAGAIRPEFAAMGEMARPLILFAVGLFALKISFFYFVMGGRGLLTPLDFAGIMFVLATYSGYLVAATTTRPAEQPGSVVARSAA